LIHFLGLQRAKIRRPQKDFFQRNHEFTFSVDFQKGAGNTKKWSEIFEKMNGEMQGAINDLEDEFRKLLGDES